MQFLQEYIKSELNVGTLSVSSDRDKYKVKVGRKLSARYALGGGIRIVPLLFTNHIGKL